MYRQVYPVQGNKPQELPAGKGTDIIRKLTARGLKRNRHEEMMQEYNEKFHEEPEETETTQKDTFSKKINAKINEYIDKNVNNK